MKKLSLALFLCLSTPVLAHHTAEHVAQEFLNESQSNIENDLFNLANDFVTLAKDELSLDVLPFTIEFDSGVTEEVNSFMSAHSLDEIIPVRRILKIGEIRTARIAFETSDSLVCNYSTETWLATDLLPRQDKSRANSKIPMAIQVGAAYLECQNKDTGLIITTKQKGQKIPYFEILSTYDNSKTLKLKRGPAPPTLSEAVRLLL